LEFLIVGEIEWGFFLPNSVRRQLFAWGKKFGEIDFLPLTLSLPPSFLSLFLTISQVALVQSITMYLEVNVH